jgi:hypothetical protein
MDSECNGWAPTAGSASDSGLELTKPAGIAYQRDRRQMYCSSTLCFVMT